MYEKVYFVSIRTASQMANHLNLLTLVKKLQNLQMNQPDCGVIEQVYLFPGPPA
jgi:Holliday junction resolvasome RuvABC endonuclease subunit